MEKTLIIFIKTRYNGITIRHANNVKYLRSIVINDETCDSKIIKRINQGRRVIKTINGVASSNRITKIIISEYIRPLWKAHTEQKLGWSIEEITTD